MLRRPDPMRLTIRYRSIACGGEPTEPSSARALAISPRHLAANSMLAAIDVRREEPLRPPRGQPAHRKDRPEVSEQCVRGIAERTDDLNRDRGRRDCSGGGE